MLQYEIICHPAEIENCKEAVLWEILTECFVGLEQLWNSKGYLNFLNRFQIKRKKEKKEKISLCS